AVAFAASLTFIQSLVIKQLRKKLAVPPASRTVALAARDCVSAVAGATIQLTAVRQGPGVFGLAVCFIAGQTNIARAHPLVMLNAIPALFALANILVALPSEERLTALFQGNVAGTSS